MSLNSIFYDKDLTYMVLCFLEFKEICKCKIICKTLYNSMDKNFFDFLAIHLYGNDFWIQAMKRTICLSKPNISSFQELKRLETFQSSIVRTTGMRYTNEQFYKLWEQMEMSYRRKKAKSYL